MEHGKAPWGSMPLHTAAAYGQVKAAEFLLSKGAPLNAKNNDGPGPQSRKQGQCLNFQQMLGKVVSFHS